jgi:transcription elongation factor Elf1
MLWLEEKYISLISYRLPLFKKVKTQLYAFRCPICGDSKKHKHKTRGGFYVPSGSQNFMMGCFNCGASMKFVTFLKQFDQVTYDEFQLESFKERNSTSTPSKAMIEPPVKKVPPKLNITGTTRLDELPDTHPALLYIKSRKIPSKQFKRLFYCPKYYEWVSKFEGTKVNKEADHPRLIIPFFDKHGNITRIAARAFGDEQPRYRYTVVNPDSTKLYGMDMIDPEKTVYVVEGPLDSLFIDNCIAVGMASYDDKELNSIPDKVFVPDNEPRNENVCKSLLKVVNRSEKVCVWQEETKKDINEMITSGKTISDVMSLIKQSTFSGVEAKLKFSEWIRCSL